MASQDKRKRPYLTIAISSRALFDLEKEHAIFESGGLEAYTAYQLENEDQILAPGCGFPLVRSILQLNELNQDVRTAEVIIVSRNNANTSLRIFNSIDHYQLDIERAILSSGADLAPYLKAFGVDLFLSRSEETVHNADAIGIASAVVYPPPSDLSQPIDQIRIAFDGDAVIFSDESERIYQEQGLEAFLEHERKNARLPLPAGPFAKLLKTLSFLRTEFTDCPISFRIALVTARSHPSVERVIRTLREWNVPIDEAFFLGGLPKEKILEAYRPHIYFDDQSKWTDSAASYVPTGKVPGKLA